MLKVINTRIIFSFVTLLVGTALIIGATFAFFSDSETSTGNILQAGAIDLGIDNKSYYNGVLNPETTWGIDYDLSGNSPRQFFNFNDLKPADYGEDTISLHVKDNDSWLCADVTLTSNDDVDCNEPETNAEGVACQNNLPTASADGDLAQDINFLWWADDGDNVLEDHETALPAGALGTLGVGNTATVVLADSQTNIWGGTGPLPGNNVRFVGKAWCFGTIAPAPLAQDGSGILRNPSDNGDGVGPAGQPTDGGYTCSGAQIGNAAQTDSVTLDIAFRAVQSRNNGQFVCGGFNPGAPIPTPVNLSSADNFVILSKSGITNIPTSSITGNIGTSPITGAAITGLGCSEVAGIIYTVNAAGPACRVEDPTLLTAAISAMETAYTTTAGMSNPTATELYGGNLGGKTLAPGLYKWSTNVTIPTNVTLSGGASDVWIFQIAGNLNIASGGDVPSGIKVMLIGGALAKNVIWQVGGGTGATLGTYSTFNGTILSAKQIIMQTGAVLNGRALAQTQVTMDANTVSAP